MTLICMANSFLPVFHPMQACTFCNCGLGSRKSPFRLLIYVPSQFHLQRGMTLAPRVQVITQLSCNAIYGHDVYDQTNLHTDHQHHHIDDNSLPELITNPDSLPSQIGTLNSFSSYIYYPLKFSSSQSTSSTDTDDDEPDPRAAPSKRCLSDPAVQAGAARIQTIMTTIMGTLSALTTGWWGHFGERHGRTRVLAFSTLGLLLTFVPPSPLIECSF